MAKDPAFLFYYQDFLVGTDDFTNEEVGAYIRCLCIQAAKGGISEKHMKNICKTQDVQKVIKEKFIFYPEEKVFRNERLFIEITKRKKYSESRSGNRLGKKKVKNISISYDPHMENENENENTIGIKDRKDSVKGREGLEYVPWFTAELKIPANTLEAAEMNQHSHTGNRNTGFVKDMWKIFLIERLSDPPIVQMQNKDVSDLSRYFLNFLRPKFPKKNGHRNASAVGQETPDDKL